MQVKSKHTVTALVAGFLTIVLAACGGGASGDTGGGASPVEKPAITVQPANQSVVKGNAAIFSVTASGGAALTYQWKKDGADISGATSSIYITPAANKEYDGAQFSVVLSNSAGTVTSNPGTLTVTDGPAAPAISRHPESLSLVTGSAASFSVSATGTSPLIYQWKKNGTDIPGATSSAYTTPATSDADIGAEYLYSVVVTNGAGTATSGNARLTVTAVVAAPAITRQPSAQTVTAGQVASFSVAATGTSPSYQWQKNGTDIPGATASSYTIVAASMEDNAAVFTVVVGNSAGQVSSSEARLAVSPAPPVITTQPAHQTVPLGETATFTVAASGTGTLRYQWQKFGANIPEATELSYTTPVTTLFDNAAEYSVLVSDSVGNTVTSSNATLVLSRYSLVRKPGGGTYDVTECVKDNSTGRIWEGKNPVGSSSRLGTTKYTNLNSTEVAQKFDGYKLVLATEDDLIAPTNSLGYVKLVNESGLCGYTDWRLPTLEELQAIVDANQNPKIDSTWFPNTQANSYWTSTTQGSAVLGLAKYVTFGT
ncbi:MAG: DUF1566 domain-containing protein, partial [Rhodoferax sp.]|nr:DUF1566 domain-containing protein [Rhodoferax sp.]